MLFRSGTGSYLQRGHDKVVLLASDTVIGQVCGRLNETLFRDYLFRIDKGDKSDVVLESIKGLNPTTDRKELFQVYPQVRSILDRHIKDDACQALFNITGGFKGLIPPITHLAWTRYARPSTKLLYMHDTMPATVTLSPGQGGFEMREEIWIGKSIYVERN